MCYNSTSTHWKQWLSWKWDFNVLSTRQDQDKSQENLTADEEGTRSHIYPRRPACWAPSLRVSRAWAMSPSVVSSRRVSHPPSSLNPMAFIISTAWVTFRSAQTPTDSLTDYLLTDWLKCDNLPGFAQALNFGKTGSELFLVQKVWEKGIFGHDQGKFGNFMTMANKSSAE